MERAEGPWLFNTAGRYGLLAVALHWAMAAVLLELLVSGFLMVRFPDVGYDRVKILWILVHKAVGMAALLLVALRIAWRAANPLPRLAAGLPEWQRFLARFVHLCLYALMVALPLTGWLMSSAGGYPVSFFGLFDLPPLGPLNAWQFEAWIAVHRWLAHALALLAFVHALAALRHHFLLGDDSLRRMLPGYRAASSTSRATSSSVAESA